MTLEELKDFWKQYSIDNKKVMDFQVGSWYDAAVNFKQPYPLVWWEMPYSIAYNADYPKRKDTVVCSMSVFLSTKMDDIADAHYAVSQAKEIGDSIITKVRLEATEFIIQSVNAVSVREYSDDYCAGMRYDITITLQREVCDSELTEYYD